MQAEKLPFRIVVINDNLIIVVQKGVLHVSSSVKEDVKQLCLL